MFADGVRIDEERSYVAILLEKRKCVFVLIAPAVIERQNDGVCDRRCRTALDVFLQLIKRNGCISVLLQILEVLLKLFSRDAILFLLF